LNCELILAMDLMTSLRGERLWQGRVGTDEERPTVREKRTENKFTIQDVTSVSRMAFLIPL
jgi:hypothetical protein